MDYEIKKFNNGLRALCVPMKSTEAATVSVLVNTGSVYETRKISGISHFLEHLFFKGSKKFPTSKDVNRALDGLGAEHNAFTSKEITGFWVKSAARHVDRSLEIVADLLINPLFPAGEIEKERGVVLQEISMYEDMPQRDVLDVFDELMYGDQPAGWNVAGTKQTVAGIARPDILRYKNTHYLASNAWVVVAGNVRSAEVFSAIGKHCSAMPRGRAPEIKKVNFSQSKPRTKIKHKSSDQSHLVFGVPAYNMFDERKYALNLLSVILGGNMSSRLFMEIREKLGLAYYVGAQTNYDTYGGSLYARAGVPHGDLTRVVKKMSAIFDQLRKNGISEREMSFAKEYLRGTMALSFESSDEVAMFYGEQAMFHKIILSPEDVFDKLARLSRADLKAVARDILNPRRLNLAVIGPHKKLDIF